VAAQTVFYLLSGPNGAGKPTLYQAGAAEGLIPGQARLVNADLFEAAELQHMADPTERSRAARTWADAERSRCLQAGMSFGSETVFPTPPSSIRLPTHSAPGLRWSCWWRVWTTPTCCWAGPPSVFRKAGTPCYLIEFWRDTRARSGI